MAASQRICSIPDCGKPAYIRGYCSAHHARWKRHGDPLGGRYRQQAKGLQCSIEGCGRPVHGHGLCMTHHHRLWRRGDPLDAGVDQKASLKWLESHVTYTGDDCLTWPFGRFASAGYGRIKVGGVGHGAHHVMCILAHGEPPSPDHEAAHSCGKGHLGCVNPRHLRWATAKENTADRIRHGTAAIGENNPAAKLTISDVAQIKSLIGTMPQVDIARRFGVAKSAITDIKYGRTWGTV